MRASTPPVCTHCQSTKSPLWRRGAQQEVLCNACGLYWKHHGCYRPLALKAAADRKNDGNAPETVEEARSSSRNSLKDVTVQDFMKAMKAKQNLVAHFSVMNAAAAANSANTAASRTQDPRKATGGPLKTANILMAPGQYGYENSVSSSSTSSSSSSSSSANLNLPPLMNNRPDLSSPLPLSNARQLTAAPVLPTLRSVLDCHHQQLQQYLQPKQVKPIGSMVMSGSADISMTGASSLASQFPSLTSSPVPVASATTVSIPPSVAKASSSLPLKFIINKGVSIYQGDHVAVLGDDSQVYFAILFDFWLTEGGRRFCTLRWLLPKASRSAVQLANQSTSVDNFTLGPVHGKVESMEAILDVFYSPYREGMTADSIRKRFLSVNEQADELAAKMLLSMS